MPVTASYIEADVAAVEAEEVNLGTVVDVTLPDGVSIVTAIRRGKASGLEMQIAGYQEKRRDEISIRGSEFVRVLQPIPRAQQMVVVRPKNRPAMEESAAQNFTIEEVSGDAPDDEQNPVAGVVYFFKLVQNW